MTEKSVWLVAFDALHELKQFVRMAWLGLDHFCNATRLQEVMKGSVETLGEKSAWYPLEITEEDVKQAVAEEEYGNEQREKGFPYLYSLATVQLWTILETLVDELLVDALTEPEKLRGSELAEKLRGPLLSLLLASEEERAVFLAGEIKQQLKSALQRGVGKLESLLEVVGLGGPVPPQVRKCLFELVEMRNCIVHRAGVADKRLCDACPWLGLTLGEAIPLGSGRFGYHRSGASWYVLEVHRRNAVALGSDAPDNATEWQQDLLRDIEAYVASEA